MNYTSFPELQSILPEETLSAAQNAFHLIAVRCFEGSDALLTFFERSSNTWHRVFSCDAHIGKAGTGKTREGDMKTPLGTFHLTTPFGILPCPDPASPLATEYIHVTPAHYWCGQNGAYYNQLIDNAFPPEGYIPSFADEHLIDYAPSYHYGLAIDYNQEGIDGLGSAIFLHCMGKHPYTAGCVAISEEFMRAIICRLLPHTPIVIFR